MKFTHLSIAAAAAIAITGIVPAQPAQALKKTVTAASCFPKGSFFSRRYEAYIEAVNKKAKGWKIRYRGGAPAIGSPFTLVQNVSKGVFDMVSCTGAYYQNVLKEADAFKMWEKTPMEIRKNGGWAYIDKLHQAKNLKLIARLHSGEPFNVYLRKGKAISEVSLKGLKLRSVPIYDNFFRALGASTLRSNIAQVYTYMENGTVDGFGWPVTGLLPDWHKVIAYRVDPGIYDADIQVIMNFDAWKKLSKAQQNTIISVGLQFEKLGVESAARDVKASIAKQTSQGIKAITMTGEKRKKWLAAAREAGWSGIVKNSPEHGPKLRKFFATE